MRRCCLVCATRRKCAYPVVEARREVELTRETEEEEREEGEEGQRSLSSGGWFRIVGRSSSGSMIVVEDAGTASRELRVTTLW